MKSILACFVAVPLLLPLALPAARGDMIPGPYVPKRDVEVIEEPLPVYEIAWSVVAVSMVVSLVVLRLVRQRNVN